MASEENVDSWTNNFLLAGCALPKKEMKKTMNPNPPNHCDKERHRSRLRGKSSTEVSAEAPVVVNPDTDSKNPVRKLQFEIRMYGSAPNNDSPMADSTLNQESLAKEVNRALDQLSPRERDILKMFFGIGCQEMTLEEIGAKFDLTRERVRQIKEKAIRRLKGQKSKLLKAYLG